MDEKTDVEEIRVWERADEKSERKKEPLKGEAPFHYDKLKLLGLIVEAATRFELDIRPEIITDITLPDHVSPTT